MTTFHEQIRLILTDVDKFCSEGLHGVKLPKKVTQDKEKILKSLNDLYEEYPNLKPEAKNKTKSKDDRDVSDGSVKTSGSGHNEEDETTDNYAEVAFKDLENPDKCGYLEKKRKKEMALFKGSQKRYCVVHKNVFYYYEKPTDKKQCGAFSLVGYAFRPAPDKIKDANKKDLCFELVAPNKRCYEFIADSKEEFDSWKEAIEKATQENSSQDDMDEIYEAIEDNFGQAEAPDPPPTTTRRPPPQTPLEEPAEYLAPNETHKPLPPMPVVPPPSLDDLPPPPPPITDEIYEDAESANIEPPLPEPPSRKTTISKPTIAPPSPPSRNPTLSKPAIAPPSPPSRNPTLSKPAIAPPSPPPPRKSPMPDRKPAPPDMPLPPTPTIPPKKQIVWPAEDFENMFYGKWDCKGGAADELSFKRGDIIHVINYDFDKDHWWVGELMGNYGMVPKDHLTRAFELVEA